MVSRCKPNWPNHYTFSKCLAENILQDKASDLPVAIVRPSIVLSLWKKPLPGHIDYRSGVVQAMTVVGKGFIRAIHCDKNVIEDVIPSDIVVNALVASAWIVATGRCSYPFVVHVTSGDTLGVTFGEFCFHLTNFSKKYQYPNALQSASPYFIKNIYIYWLYAFYQHYIPAAVLDLFSYLKGSKFRLLPLYKLTSHLTSALHFFWTNDMKFETRNFKSLSQILSPEDNEMIYTDIKDLTVHDFLDNIPYGSDTFDWKHDKKSPERRKRDVYVNTMVISSIRWIVLFLMCYMLYNIFVLLI